ncbi:hypothetical protein [Enterococcus nangangensis]|uniref:hypothetical protein n=1 Tax=Enterococcus nangangensis TaxID=2559926 RepID=UPI0010FA4E1A|nr:hypothetical protein [Enterococcus nangangensis]
MGLLDTLKAIKDEGFDAKNDKINKSQRLDAGKYGVRLKSAQAGQNNMKQDQIAITLEVISGKDKGRLEVIYISFDEGIPAFVLEKNGRTLLKLAAMVGVEFKNKDLEDEYSAAEALAKGVGQQFKMDLTISPNKKNPDYPYRNYDFEQFEDSIPTMEEDEDLPF